MPKEASVAIIDDKEFHRKSISMLLEVYGHFVNLTASTTEEARAIIAQFNERGIQVAFVKTVGISASGFVMGADVNLNLRSTPEELNELVTSL